MRHAAIVAVLLVPTVAAAKPKKIGVDAGNGSLILTFDPAKISEADLRVLAEVYAPERGPDGVVTASLESCRDTAGAVTACGTGPHTPAQPAFFRDGELTLKENAAIVKAAASATAPKELEPAKEWIRRYRAFHAGLEERKLAYYKSWKTADLVPPIEGVDGATACAGLVAKLDATASKDDKYKLAHHDWHNCMNDRGHAVIGEYPKAPWKAFLKAKKITAKYVLESGD